MSDPTLKDCINYMKSQLKQMEKYPRSYEYNIPYYRKTVEYLEKRMKQEEEAQRFRETMTAEQWEALTILRGSRKEGDAE